MQLQRLLSLVAAAVAACALSAKPARALDFADALQPNEEERIYGGEEAAAEKYPFTVSLRKTATGATYCGGALVAAQYVVTAAHCVKNVTTFASIGTKYSSGATDGERIQIAESYVHPGYVKDTHVNDVAVLKLAKPTTSKTLGLCKADGSDNQDGETAVVRGWGMTEKNVAATVMLEVNVKIVSNAVCNKSYNNRITEGMLCAGEGGGKDTCQGDSGGPLIANDVLVGVVSWGGKCGEAPGVYTRVTSVLDFINEKIGGAAEATPTPPTTAPAVSPTTAPATTAPATTAPDGAPTAAPAATTTAPAAAPTIAPAATTSAPATTTTPSATTDAPKTPEPAASPTSAPASDSDASKAPTTTPTTLAPMPVAPGKGKDVVPSPVVPAPAPAPSKKKKDCKVLL